MGRVFADHVAPYNFVACSLTHSLILHHFISLGGEVGCTAS